MTLPNHMDETAWAAKLGHDLPEALMTDCVEGLGQVNEDRVELAILLLAFLLELLSRKQHVNCTMPLSETTLALWK